MKLDRRAIGRFTEDMAAQALVQKGYHILEQNFANKFGEIDIIAKDGDTLVFVEVKAKTGLEFGWPEEMVTPGKLNKIKRMAMVYTNGEPRRCRIDVVAIVLSPSNQVVRLTHYENVC